MNLFELEFRVFARGRQADTATILVHLERDLETSFDRMTEQLAHHDHHVFKRVVVVIPKNDMVAGLTLRS